LPRRCCRRSLHSFPTRRSSDLVFRMSAWKTVIIGAVVTILLAILVWQAPVGGTLSAYGLGAATGVWAIDWIVFWGVIIYNTLVRSEEHTSELQSRFDLVCSLLL